MDSNKESPCLLDNLLFPKIFQAFRMAIQPSKLVLALLAVAVVCLTGWIMDFGQTIVTIGDGSSTELHIYVENGSGSLNDFLRSFSETGERTGVFATLWNFGAARFHSALSCLFRFDIPGVAANVVACFRALIWAFQYHLIYSIAFFAVVLAVMSVAGGAICRIAAMQFARGEKLRLTEALRFSLKRFTSYFTAPLAPVCIIGFIGLFIFILGLAGNIPWVGELMIGVGIPLVLVASALMAVVALGALGGFNLMFPAVAYDNSDCFDSISRSFSYLYAKPWRMGFYTVTAAVYGAISYVFVRFFAFLLLWVSYRSLQCGILGDNTKLAAIWPEPSFTKFLGTSSATPAVWTEHVAAFLMYISVLTVIGLVVSFVVSFYFSASAIIYCLMRNRIDNTALAEIYTYSEETDAESATLELGLPETGPKSAPATENS